VTAVDDARRMSSPATLRDVARLAGVHPGTASRALNAETRSLVKEATLRRVLNAAAELSYRPNPIARSLRTSRSFTAGVVIPDITNPLFPPIVRGIEDALNRTGYTALIANTDNDPARERHAVEALRARQVDGFIAASARHEDRALEELVELGVPVALVNRRFLDGRVPAVTVDHRRGVRLAIEHLAALGHRRIAHLGGPQTLSTGSERYAGFVDAMRAVGLEADPDLVLFGDALREHEGARLCAELLARGEAFTAIVAANDLMALGCYDVVAERGLSCPGDLSVVGFNDMPFAARFSPPLTTVHVPQYRMGVAAAELLLERIGHPAAPSREVLLPPALVVRGSTGPPPSAA
jgi:LacI family transcriptional regulator